MHHGHSGVWGCAKHCDELLIQDLSHGLGHLVPHDKSQGTAHKVISDHQHIFDAGQFVELHGRFHTSEIYVDELQWCMCPNWTQGSLWYGLIKDVAPLATSNQSSTVFNHYGPSESLLCEGQCPLLILVSCVTLNSIKCHMMLISQNQKGQNPFHLPLLAWC